MKRLCYQMISLPTMPLLERDLTCQALLGIVYHQMRYRCLWGRSFDFLEQVLAESWSDHLSHPRSHVVIRPPDFTYKDTVDMIIFTLIIIHLTAITLIMIMVATIKLTKLHKKHNDSLGSSDSIALLPLPVSHPCLLAFSDDCCTLLVIIVISHAEFLAMLNADGHNYTYDYPFDGNRLADHQSYTDGDDGDTDASGNPDIAQKYNLFGPTMMTL